MRVYIYVHMHDEFARCLLVQGAEVLVFYNCMCVRIYTHTYVYIHDEFVTVCARAQGAEVSRMYNCMHMYIHVHICIYNEFACYLRAQGAGVILFYV